MKVSIVISIYQSYEVVRRQYLHFQKMHLPNDVEIIFVDDGSDPPITTPCDSLPNFAIYPTHNTLAWTQGIGRNLGASKAIGKYLFMTDIDHIISKEAIMAARVYTGDYMLFRRFFGVLLEDGTFTQDINTLIQYGFDPIRLEIGRGLYASVHQNTFVIRKSIFDELGGYDPRHSLVGYHPITRRGDDVYFHAKWKRWEFENNGQTAEGPPIYMFPIGRYHIRGETNPMGMFHNLSYDGKTRRQKGEEHAAN